MLPVISTAFTLTITLIGLYYIRRHNRSKLPLPPGPRKRFLVGNLFDIPSSSPWETYTEWSKTYESDIIHLDAAGHSLIILSSLESAVDLLEKRSAIYSDRPQLTMANELMGWDFHLAFMKYGEPWRVHRRLFHNAFQAEAAKSFHPKELSSVHVLLRRILEDPQGDVMARIQQMTAEIIMSVAYGIDILPAKDPYVDLAEESVHTLTRAIVPGAFLVDVIPLLKYVPEWFPGAGFQRKAKEWKAQSQKMQDLPFEETKRRMAEGTAPHSFVADALENLEDIDDREHHERLIKATAGAMYSAGTDTTSSALGTFVLAMLANPEAQKKAQFEIDSVVPRGRLPDFNDEASWPYVSALVKEVLRWQPVAPLGVFEYRFITADQFIGFPHQSSDEDEYRGYRIPAGSTVMANMWAIFHDEAIFADPYTFKPEHFLLDGKPHPNIMNPDVVFGFGRRICPARHMAASTIWITAASILATFDITKATADDGQIIEPTYEYTATAINVTPLPFKCSIKPRSKETASLIQATLHEEQ